jgi:hypothetical protein
VSVESTKITNTLYRFRHTALLISTAAQHQQKITRQLERGSVHWFRKIGHILKSYSPLRVTKSEAHNEGCAAKNGIDYHGSDCDHEHDGDEQAGKKLPQINSVHLFDLCHACGLRTNPEKNRR